LRYMTSVDDVRRELQRVYHRLDDQEINDKRSKALVNVLSKMIYAFKTQAQIDKVEEIKKANRLLEEWNEKI